MTQTASISSLNKKSFLKKAFKNFNSSKKGKIRDMETPSFPIPEKDKFHT